jgi:nucleoid DNA-binding protein
VLLKNVEKYISELLFEHDCVIIPAFGGFVARNASANYTKTGNVLLPPSKSIVFNKNLSNNDGLLAGYIMQQENASYQQANTIIENFVAHCKQQLETQKRFELLGLGVLYKSIENTVLFEQDTRINHNTYAFGLPAVSAIKIVPEEKLVNLKSELQYRQITPVKKPKPIRRIAIAASVALCIFTVLFIATKQNPFNNVQATVNPFGANKKNKVVETKNIPSTPVIKIEKENTAVKPTIIADTVSIDKTGVAKKTEATITAWYKQPYQIVVGCFAVKQNAYKLINKLGQQNLQASIAGQNAKDLYVVSVAGFADEPSARKKLLQIKEQYTSAWLFKR